MDVRTGPLDARLEEARSRWRVTADRLWPVAMADGDRYRHAAELVGTMLGELRRTATTIEGLLATDAEPGAVLSVLPEGAAAGLGGPRVLLDAACAVRGDELVAARARERRIGLIAAARREGASWVVLEDRESRSVEMHLGTGLALVATADPYAGSEPYGLGEIVLDAGSGDPVAGPAQREVSFPARADWVTERARWRTEISTRLDDDGTDGFR